MVLDLNKLPYFDDYDETKNYHKILFKPGVAVQARELTQLQSILQNQIERFGKHIFQQGTIVLGGAFDPQDPIDYVRVSVSSTDILDDLLNSDLTGALTGLKANVIHVEVDDIEAGVAVLFVRYLNSSNTATTFQSSEVLTNSVEDLTVINNDPTGTASIFGISDGVVFSNGFFIRFDSQKISLNKYSANSNARVYFKTEFTEVDYNSDTSLLDNAQGFNNFNAPGADRLRATITLQTSALDVDLSDENHSLILEIKDGIISVKNERTIYSRVKDESAKRTFDESGDYVVRGWNLFSREHLDTGTNGGRLDAGDGGNTSLVSIGIEPGLGYVKGYEIENIATQYVDIPKSDTFVSINNQTSVVRSGNYILVNEITGLPEPDKSITINLYDTAENRVSNSTIYSASPTGSKIGEAELTSYLDPIGTLGQANAQIRVYLTNIQMNSNQVFQDVRAIQATGFFADTVLDATTNNAVIYDTEGFSRLHYVGSDAVKSITDSNGDSDTSITFNRQKSGTLGTNGQGSITVSTSDESLPYGTGTLLSLSKESLFLTIDAETEVTLTGNVDVTSGNTTVTGSGTAFTNLNIGDRLKISGADYNIASITSDAELELETTSAVTSTEAAVKVYLKGDLIDLNGKGSDAGATRTVTATSTTLSINLQETLDSSASFKLTFRITRQEAVSIPKDLRPDRYVVIDGSSAANSTVISLGISDVYQIKEIRKSSNVFTSNTEGVDVTSDYTLNSGQTLFSYENATIESDTALGSSEYLLVRLDHFEPDFTTGLGYFSIDSYPINDALESDTTIKTINIPVYNDRNYGRFDLRNFIDTRPIKTNTANSSTTVAGASVNPTPSGVYNVPTDGLRFPVPGTNIVFDYSYFLARRDILAVDKNGTFVSVQGVPSLTPGFPKVSESFMQLANIEVPPYPSIAGTFGRILDKRDEAVATTKVTNNRYTMKNIDALAKRIHNLEYYNSLNVLEKNLLNMSILDENGLDRFKNGIFVDPFADHSLADAGNQDYKISIDKQRKEIRPIVSLDSFESPYSNSSNMILSSDILSLPYTETTLIDQPYATTTRNIELSSYRFIGALEVFPEVDVWSDISTVDKVTVENPELEIGTTVNVEWSSWTSYVTGAVTGKTTTTTGSQNGFTVYKRKIFELENDFRGGYGRQVLGTYDTMAQAKAALASAGSAWTRAFIASGGGSQTTTTRLETVTYRRTGVETTTTVNEELEELGAFVTDVSLIPYIRPQTLRLYAQGLKPNTRYYTFFDNENMSSYVTPVTIVGTDLTDLTNMGDRGDSLFSNDAGDALCYLRLPETGKQFRVGTREIILTDNPTNDNAATSYAIGSFFAGGLSLQKQNNILATRVAATSTRDLSETNSTQRTITSTSVSGGVQRFGPSCAAYSFYIDEPEDNQGIYLSSADIWIESMHPTLGVWFELREITNGGSVSTTQVPGSVVWMKRDDPRINLSTDGITNSTNVNFNQPIFLYNKTQYALVIHTEGLNPDTYFWVSSLGGTDVATGNPVTGRQLTGTFFTTNNNLNYDIVPDVDLKVKFNRANFTTLSGSATFTNDDLEFLSSNTSLPEPFFNVGEGVKGSDILEITLNGANTVVVGDIIRNVDGNEAHVVSIDGTEISTNGHYFSVGANVDIYTSANTAKETGSITTVDFGTAIVRSIDNSNNSFILEKSNGRFFVGNHTISLAGGRFNQPAGFSTNTPSYSNLSESRRLNIWVGDGDTFTPATTTEGSIKPEFTIEQFDRFEYTASNFRPGYINHDGDTSVSFSYVGLKSDDTYTDAIDISGNSDNEFDEILYIRSRSEEISELAGDKSVKITANVSSDSSYLSPVLDAGLTGVVYIMNQLNDDANTENLSVGGALDSKYISQIIQLDEDFESEDIMAFVAEYRPDTTDVKVYARIKSKYDFENIQDKEWFELETTKAAVSSSSNKENYIDTQYTIPEELKTGADGEVQYVSGDGNTYTGFSQMQFKIGLSGSNPAVYPKAAQLRAIALQV